MSNGFRTGGYTRFSLFPPVIKSIIIINVVVFVLQYFLIGRLTFGDTSLENLFIKYLYLWPLGEDSYFYPWQLITYQFIHGGFWHIAMNLFALWMFGAELEAEWGSKKFLIFYLLSGIGAGLIQLFIAPLFAVAAPTVGASGSIFGVLLAFGMMFPDRPIFMFPIFIPIPAKIFVIIMAGINLLSGITGTGGNVAYFAHLGGALTGFLLLKFGEKLGIYRFFENLFSRRHSADKVYGTYKEPEVYRPQWHKQTRSYSDKEVKYQQNMNSFRIDGEEITQSKIDEILDKISESGYQNLTDREKAILYELSKKLK